MRLSKNNNSKYSKNRLPLARNALHGFCGFKNVAKGIGIYAAVISGVDLLLFVYAEEW